MPVAGRVLRVDAYNPLQLLWALALAWAVARLRPRVAIRWKPTWNGRHAVAAVGAALAAFVVLAAPLIVRAAGIALRGDYVTQHYLWRSAPAGVDAATLILGNPFNGLWGQWVRGMYAHFQIDPIESGTWLGLAPLALAALAVGRSWHRPAVRQWTAVAAVFLIWALGPHLMVFGRNTGMILPQTLLRYVPVVANARMPGRAVVVVALALALLAAVGLRDWQTRVRRPAVLLVVVVCAVMLDYLPAPFALTTLDHPAIYDVLRDRPESGAVCELPLGLADGFGQVGRFDDRTLFYQTIYERPMTGGFVARLAPSVLEAYRADPLLSALLTLSSPAPAGAPAEPLPDRAEAAAELRRDRIRFVMLDRRTASAALVAYVERVLPLTPVSSDSRRSLYLVTEE